MPINRRNFLAGSAAIGLATHAEAQSLDIASLGLVPNGEGDQSAILQAAIDKAAARGVPLFLPAGIYRAARLTLSSGLSLSGIRGGTILMLEGEGPILSITDAEAIAMEGITLDGGSGTLGGDSSALLTVVRSSAVTLAGASVRNSPRNCIAIDSAAMRIDDCEIAGAAETGIFSLNSLGVSITNNAIHSCNNGGIRIWRSEKGPDGSTISGNSITAIGWTGGGNGQNGNGVNIYLADNVIVADNHFADCAFTAVRINAGRNSVVTGNTCLASGEVAIFAEFGFSGAVISNNIIDGAFAGISMTNLDVEGALAVCSGNIVRNLHAGSAVNPDSQVPFGIYAEADAAITGNVIENVPGIGIGAGHGLFLRNVLISDNLIRATKVGIAVSVADTQGSVRIDGNLLSSITDHPIIGLLWTDIASTDLTADVGKYPHVLMGENSVVE